MRCSAGMAEVLHRVPTSQWLPSRSSSGKMLLCMAKSGFPMLSRAAIVYAVSSFTAAQWTHAMERLAEALPAGGPPLRLCLIGSAACLFGGMEGRTSLDLDVWKPASDYDRLELQRATEAAGLLFDPKSVLEPDTPYIQIVEPGLTELGPFEPILIERLGRLHLHRPPIENLIAAKLIRAEPKDLADIRFLFSLHRPSSARIREIVASFSHASRARAGENLVYLEVFQP